MTRAVFAGAAAGFVVALSYLPAGYGWTMFFSLSPVLFLARGRTPLQSAVIGWAFGATAWAGGMFWLPATIAAFLKQPFIVGALGFAALSAWQGLMGFFLAGGTAWLSARLPGGLRGRGGQVACFVAVGLAVEGFFPVVFPVLFASTQHWRPEVWQSAEIFGGAGVSALILFVNGAFYAVVDSFFKDRRNPEWRWAAAALVLLAANEQYGRTRLAQIDAELAARPGPGIRLAVLQGALGIYEKRREGAFERNLASHNGLIEEARARGPVDLVIWPETTWRQLREKEGALEGLNGEPLNRLLEGDLRAPEKMLLGSLVHAEQTPGGRYNAALLIGESRRLLGSVYKRHRMPFGEYLPLAENSALLHKLSPRTTRVLAGKEQRLLVLPDGLRLGVLICYEDMVGEFTRAYADMGADLLVNMTNDAWFGGHLAEMHLRYVSLRSVETRRHMVRAVNTGITALIDPAGRIAARLPGGERGVLSVEVKPLSYRPPFLRFGRLLYWLALAACLAAAGAAVVDRGSRP